MITKEPCELIQHPHAWPPSLFIFCSNECCPKYCQGCGKNMDQPYRMPCGIHHVGECCREEIFREKKPNRCPVDDCDCLTAMEDWSVDKHALENRYHQYCCFLMSSLVMIISSLRSFQLCTCFGHVRTRMINRVSHFYSFTHRHIISIIICLWFYMIAVTIALLSGKQIIQHEIHVHIAW